MGRQGFVLFVALAFVTGVPGLAYERRGRVRFSGRGIPGGGSYTGPVMSREELGECARTASEINRLAEVVDSSDAALEAEHAELERLAADLDGQGARMNSPSNAAIDHYNRQVDTLRARSSARQNTKAQRLGGKADHEVGLQRTMCGKGILRVRHGRGEENSWSARGGGKMGASGDDRLGLMAMGSEAHAALFYCDRPRETDVYMLGLADKFMIEMVMNDIQLNDWKMREYNNCLKCEHADAVDEYVFGTKSIRR